MIAALLLAMILAAPAIAECESTTWIDDFSEVAVERIESRQGQSVDNRQWFASGIQRRDETKGWPVPAGAPPEVTIRQVMERGSSAPMTCWMAAELHGVEVDGPNQYCRSNYYGPAGASIPLNGATHWYVITDHIGVDGITRLRGSTSTGASPFIDIRHGFANKATVWTAPIHPTHLAEGALYYPIILNWLPRATVDGQVVPVPHSRWGVVRFGIGPAEGACLPSATPPEEPSPGPGYSALRADGERLFDHETWQGNGRTCETCHSRSTRFRLTLASAQRFEADPLYWRGLGEDPEVTRATARTLAHRQGFAYPADLLEVPTLLGLRYADRFGSLGIVDSFGAFMDAGIADHLSFGAARVAGFDYREASEWERAAMEEFVRSLKARGNRSRKRQR